MPRTPENGARIVFRCDRRVDLADARLALPLFGRGAIELGPRNHPLVQQPLHAVEVEVRQIALRFGRRQLRALLPGVEDAPAPRPREPTARIRRRCCSTTPGRSALTVTPRTAATVPIAVNVDGQSSWLATIVVTASGGGWNAAPCAIAT